MPCPVLVDGYWLMSHSCLRSHEPTYGSVGARRGQQPPQPGPELTHAQYQQLAAGGQHAAAAARIGRNISNEKISANRNPTILRKSRV